jgi:hypothetical protein
MITFVGNQTLAAADLNANFAEVVSGFTAVGPYVVSGLVPSAGAGLSVDVTAGTALITGYISVGAFTIGSLAPSTTNHLYLLSTGSGTSNTTGTAPANSVKLGTAVTGVATVSSVDTTSTSGRQSKVGMTDTAMLSATNTFTAEPNTFSAVPAATTQRAVVNIGSVGFTGGANHFVGNSAGTLLGLNSAAAFGGDLIVAQVGGANRMVLGNAGGLSLFGGSTITRTDAGTNNVLGALTLKHLTSATSAAGFGVQFQAFLEDDAGTEREAGNFQFRITDATAAGWGTNIGFFVYKAGAIGEPFTVRSVGTSPGEVRVQGDFNHATSGGQVAFFGVTKVSRQTVGAAATDPATTQTLANNLHVSE